MDILNPAVQQQTILTPKDIADIRENPALMEYVARAMGAVNLDNLFRQMQNPDVAVQHKIEFQRLLNRMGKLEPNEKEQGGGQQVIINITRARDDSAVVIEGKVEPADDAA